LDEIWNLVFSASALAEKVAHWHSCVSALPERRQFSGSRVLSSVRDRVNDLSVLTPSGMGRVLGLLKGNKRPRTGPRGDGAKNSITSTAIIFLASLIVIVRKLRSGETEFYIAPPDKIEKPVRRRGKAHAAKLTRRGTPRSIRFRKELPRELLAPWRNAWHLLGEPLRSGATPD
jgi:hypothetical protein